jgi:excisionase family DNA binding protein
MKNRCNPLDYIMGVEEAAKLWGYKPGYIKNLCAQGKIEAKKIGKTWVISKNQPHPRENAD